MRKTFTDRPTIYGYDVHRDDAKNGDDQLRDTPCHVRNRRIYRNGIERFQECFRNRIIFIALARFCAVFVHGHPHGYRHRYNKACIAATLPERGWGGVPKNVRYNEMA